jgi:hypothetical protein
VVSTQSTTRYRSQVFFFFFFFKILKNLFKNLHKKKKKNIFILCGNFLKFSFQNQKSGYQNFFYTVPRLVATLVEFAKQTCLYKSYVPVELKEYGFSMGVYMKQLCCGPAHGTLYVKA